MHISLSDLVTCPRCGPAYGLVLVPAWIQERRVKAGMLGCANCRERYPIREGVVWFEAPAGAAAEARVGESRGPGAAGSSDAVVKVAAVLGLAAVRGVVLLGGRAVVHGSGLARLIEGIEVVVLEGPGSESSGAGVVSRFRTGAVVPLRNGSVAAVAWLGPVAEAMVAEAVRVLRPGGRLLVDPAPPALRARLESASVSEALHEDGMLVVERRV